MVFDKTFECWICMSWNHTQLTFLSSCRTKVWCWHILHGSSRMVQSKVSLHISLAHTCPEKKEKKKTFLSADDRSCQKAASFIREMSSQKVQHKTPSHFHEAKFNPNHSDGLTQWLGKQLHLLDCVLGETSISQDSGITNQLCLPLTEKLSSALGHSNPSTASSIFTLSPAQVWEIIDLGLGLLPLMLWKTVGVLLFPCAEEALLIRRGRWWLWTDIGAWIQIQISAPPALKKPFHFSVFQCLFYTVRIVIAIIHKDVVRLSGQSCLECRSSGNGERHSVIYLLNVYHLFS